MKRRVAEEPEIVQDEFEPGSGKGRPTPKRRDVVGQRGPVTAPKTRKEAYARQKQQTREAKVARQSSGKSQTPAERRAALRSGDVLPRRDQGTTRKIARDYVDSHRMFSNGLLALFPLMILTYVPAVQKLNGAWVIQIVIIAVFLALLAEWYLVGRKLRAVSIERTGEAQGGAMTIGFYAGSRAYLPRRWRLPAPQKSLGDEY
ncbi:MAG: DUF3043 domain-containing protein [Jatrophihabitantaceae bacterium]